MEVYKPEKGIGAVYILISILIGDGFSIFLMQFLDSFYTLLSLLSLDRFDFRI